VAGEPCAANLRGVVGPAGRLLGASKQRLGAQREGARGRGWARGAMLPGPVVASRLVWQGVCDGECTRGVMSRMRRTCVAGAGIGLGAASAWWAPGMDAFKHHAMRFPAMRFPDSVCEYSRRVTAPWLSHSCEFAVCVCCAVLCCAVLCLRVLGSGVHLVCHTARLLCWSSPWCGITLPAAAGLLWLVAAPVSCRMETNRKRLRKGMESNSMRSCMHEPAEGGRTGWCGGLWRSACPWVGPSGVGCHSLYFSACLACLAVK
jgi:hypothetical protein